MPDISATEGFVMFRVASNRFALSAGLLSSVDWPPIFAAVAKAWRQLHKALLDTYRPELHYMRGPGDRPRQHQQRAGPSVWRAHRDAGGRRLALDHGQSERQHDAGTRANEFANAALTGVAGTSASAIGLGKMLAQESKTAMGHLLSRSAKHLDICCKRRPFRTATHPLER
jgi:hypothetical protein